MDWITNIKIEIQRWNVRRKNRKGKRIDTRMKFRAIRQAEKRSSKSKVRLWVLRVRPGEFKILTKGEIKGGLRAHNLATNINMYQTGEIIVHITNKIHEI